MLFRSVIAHRFSTLRHADRILVLDQGRLVGFDSHARLLATCKTYGRLWSSQTALIHDSPQVVASRRHVVDV